MKKSNNKIYGKKVFLKSDKIHFIIFRELEKLSIPYISSYEKASDIIDELKKRKLI